MWAPRDIYFSLLANCCHRTSVKPETTLAAATGSVVEASAGLSFRFRLSPVRGRHVRSRRSPRTQRVEPRRRDLDGQHYGLGMAADREALGRATFGDQDDEIAIYVSTRPQAVRPSPRGSRSRQAGVQTSPGVAMPLDTVSN
jgi:hypothetical protein